MPIYRFNINMQPESISDRAQKLRVNPKSIEHAERVFAEIARPVVLTPPAAVQPGEAQDHERVPALEDRLTIETIIEAVFADPDIIREFTARSIRHVAICGQVAKALLDIVGKADEINLLTVGTVDLPDFILPTIETIIERGNQHNQRLRKKYLYGYDLPGNGTPEALGALFRYFDEYYQFSQRPELEEKLIRNSSLTAGGSRTLQDFASGMLERARKKEKRARFIQPDNSYDSWQKNIDRRTYGGQIADIHYLGTKPENMLHLTKEDVERFYDKNPPTDKYSDTWYITPVGNPSGTIIDPHHLEEVCEAIVERNPDAVIMLDCVYVHFLEDEKAAALLRGVISNPKVFDRVVLLESFSKHHGICRERLSYFTAPNKEIYDYVQNAVMSDSAGAPMSLNGLAMALAQATPEEEEGFRKLHKFWALERKGLYYYLMQFPQFFEDDQPHITEDNLNNPSNLYLFPKLKPDVNSKEVFLATKCLGVETEMNSGRYIRFAVGTISKPTFAKYIPQAA